MDELAGSSAGTPEGGAPESAFDEARAALTSADGPASSKPDPAASTAAAKPTSPTAEETERSVSQRQANREFAERIQRETEQRVRAQIQAEQHQRDADQQRQDAQRAFWDMVKNAKDGDYRAARELGELLESNASTQTIQSQARTGLLNEIAQDFRRLPALDGLNMADLHGAPSISELVYRTYAQARAAERATWESRYQALAAENTGLKGRLAGHRPSPERANGSPFTPGSGATGMRGYFEEAKAELAAA